METTKKYFDHKFDEFREYLELTFVKKDEFLGVRNTVREIKNIVGGMDKRDKEDSNMFAGIVIGHDQRITKLEKVTKKA